MRAARFVMATRAVRVVSGGRMKHPQFPGLPGLPGQLGGGLAEGGEGAHSATSGVSGSRAGPRKANFTTQREGMHRP